MRKKWAKLGQFLNLNMLRIRSSFVFPRKTIINYMFYIYKNISVFFSVLTTLVPSIVVFSYCSRLQLDCRNCCSILRFDCLVWLFNTNNNKVHNKIRSYSSRYNNNNICSTYSKKNMCARMYEQNYRKYMTFHTFYYMYVLTYMFMYVLMQNRWKQ